MDHVVIGALVQRGRVLLAHRRRDKAAYPDVWDLPGGVVEAGERERDALARELREELGVRIAPDSATLLTRVQAGPEAAPARISAWLVRAWEGTPANVATEEHQAIGWFTTADLPPLLHAPVEASLREAMRDA